MNILLFRCLEINIHRRIKSPSYKPSQYPPLGLMYVGAALEQDGHHVQIIDLGVEEISDERLQQEVNHADCIGINVYTNSYHNAALLTQRIRDIDEHIPIIIGGPHCIFVQERALHDIPAADIAVIGEGEEVIRDIIGYLQENKPLHMIPSIVYREKQQIKKGKPLKKIEDLDSLPFPGRHLVDKYDYGNFPLGYKVRKKFTFMMTSRGCPFHCRFCARYNNIIPGFGVRNRSAENVVQELQALDGKYRSVAIVDDNFLANTKRAYQICDLLGALDLDIDFLIMGARVDTAEYQLYQKMKQIGVQYIGYGLESGNQDVLDYYNKKITLQQMRHAVSLAKKVDFCAAGTFILGAPIETKEHIMKTINFACSLPLDIVLFGILNYEMGSPLWVEAVQQQKISEHEYMVPASLERGLSPFTEKQLHAFVMKAFQRFYLRPSYIFRQFYQSSKHNDFGMFFNGVRTILNV